jgi:broad specificity phosphatase PhoE
MPDTPAKNSPVTLWLVRHGQTDWNLEGRYQGQTDPPLNAAGLAEAERAAALLADQPIDAIYTSDLQRAVQTAAAISRACGIPYQVEQRLREIDLGEWEGELFTEIKARYPDLIEARRRDPLDFHAPGAESLREVAERVWEATDAIATRHPGQTVVIVSHGVALAPLITRAAGEDLAQAYRHIPDNAAPQQVTVHLNPETHATPPGKEGASREDLP